MNRDIQRNSGWYGNLIFKRPTLTIAMVAALIAFFAFQIRDFKLDASSDSLLLENDADLRVYEQIRRLFGSEDYLVVTYRPDEDLFSRESLDRLQALVEAFETLDSVEKVNSILSAPLFQSPKVPLMSLATGFQTLQKPTVDVALARVEFMESPVYRNLIISADGNTSAIQITFVKNEALETLSRQRSDLRFKKHSQGLNSEEEQKLREVEAAYQRDYDQVQQQWAQDVAAVRSIMENHRNGAEIYLGGVPMIVSDMIDFVRRDLVVFGAGVLVFLIVALTLIFKSPRWVLLPLLTCVSTGLIMIGFLGWTDWRATVISSNFLSLLFIITMSMAIHLAVRYRELHTQNPDADHRSLVFEAACLVAKPCLYCALTTMVGFGSLLVSGIKPVIEFGRMMAMGIGVGYLVCFSLFPALLCLLPKAAPIKAKRDGFSMTAVFAGLTAKHGTALLLVGVCLLLLGGWGITRLTVENRFIDYFKKDTEIYKGMVVIDTNLGGTTPLDVVLTGEGDGYWYQPQNLARLRQVHEFLDEMPETGKVLSLDSMMKVVEEINNGKPLSPFLMGLLRQFIPKDIKAEIIRPYMSDDGTKARISVRIKESYPDLRREALLGKINQFLTGNMSIEPNHAKVNGVYVLYNNLLQSLFQSQITTIGVVFLATWLMFSVLFRSFYLATIAIVPNVFPVVFVLGTLGWLNIPLDMMTITIAAITIGIAVDHTIHYIHRFKTEFPRIGSYRETMVHCHRSIGKAMYYTSITIIFGFSILVLSNFIPTIYFGLFTGLAMVVALAAALTILPQLMILLKPMGPGG